jgi:hypothetical protein
MNGDLIFVLAVVAVLSVFNMATLDSNRDIRELMAIINLVTTACSLFYIFALIYG